MCYYRQCPLCWCVTGGLEGEDEVTSRGPRGTRSVLAGFAQRYPRSWSVLYRNRILLFTVLLVLTAGSIMATLFQGNLVQALVSGIVVGSIYVLGATGLSLIYGIKKFANFAHGDLLTLGAYMAFSMNVGLGLHLFFGFLTAMVTLALVGILLELLIFRRLEGKGVVAPLIASVGVFIIIQNAILSVFEQSPKSYNVLVFRDWSFGIFQINPIKGVATLAVAVAATAALHFMLSRTTLGKSMRATSDNPELARASGIHTGNVALWTWVVAGLLAGLSGALLGLAIDVRPLLGFNILLFLFAAVIIGGIGSPYGAMVGGFLVGVIQELSGIVLDWLARPDVVALDAAAAYRPMAAFLIMVVVLLVKPEGLMGTAGRQEARGAGLRARLSRR